MPECLSLGARLLQNVVPSNRLEVLTGNSCRPVRGAAISPYAFEGCEKLEAGAQMINISHSSSSGKAFAQCQQLAAIDLSHTQVGIINVQVFSNCPSLTQATLPKHLTKIRAEAFEACILLCTADASTAASQHWTQSFCRVQQTSMPHPSPRRGRQTPSTSSSQCLRRVSGTNRPRRNLLFIGTGQSTHPKTQHGNAGRKHPDGCPCSCLSPIW